MHEIWVSCEWMLIMRRRYKSCTSGRSRLPSSRYHWSLHPGLGCPGQCWGDRQYSQAADPAQGSTPVPTHLQVQHGAPGQLAQCSCEGLSPGECSQLRSLLTEFHYLFAAKGNERARVIRCDVNAGTALPIRQWRWERTLRQKWKRWRQPELSAPRTAPGPLMARKKDGSFGFCVDYRQLNAVTNRDSYLFPHTDDTLGSTGGLLG